MKLADNLGKKKASGFLLEAWGWEPSKQLLFCVPGKVTRNVYILVV